MNNETGKTWAEVADEEKAMIDVVTTNKAMNNSFRVDLLVDEMAKTISSSDFRQIILNSGVIKTDKEADAFVWFYYERGDN